MRRKETTLSLSTVQVSTLAVAVLLGHLVLRQPPPPYLSPSSEAARMAGSTPPVEVPTVDAGRAFERHHDSARHEIVSDLSTGHELFTGDLSSEELQAMWKRGITSMPRRAKVCDPSAPVLLATLAATATLGLAAFFADASDAAAEEQKRQAKAAPLHKKSEGARKFQRLYFPIAVCVAFATAALTREEDSRRRLVAADPPPAMSLSEAVTSLLLTQSATSFGDGPVSAVLAVLALLGLWVALTDVNEMAMESEEEEMREQACGSPPPTSRCDVQSRPVPWLHVTSAAVGLAAIVWITVWITATAAAAGVGEAELTREATSVVMSSFRWAPPNEATTVALGIACLIGAAVSCSDVQDEAERFDREVKAQAVRVAE